MSQLRIATVSKGDIIDYLDVTGRVESLDTRVVSTSVAGRVERIHVRSGGRVDVTTAVVELQNAEIAEALAASKAKVDEARAQLTSQRANLDVGLLAIEESRLAAVSEYKTLKFRQDAEQRLVESQIISKLQLEQTRNAAEGLAERIDIAARRMAAQRTAMSAQLAGVRVNLNQLENDVAANQRSVQQLMVTAGAVGVLQLLSVREGDEVSAGAKVAEVSSPDKLGVMLSVSPGQARQVSPGQKVEIDSGSGIVVGRVAQILPSVENGAVGIEVVIGPHERGRLRIGQMITARIEIGRINDVTYVERPELGRARSASTALVVDRQGMTARPALVTFGRATPRYIEVLSGLNAGDRMIVSGVTDLDQERGVTLR